MKTNKAAYLAAILLTFAVLLTGCGAKTDPEELKSALSDLIPRAAELNEVYFGAGLPMSADKAEAEAFYAKFDTDIAQVNYAPVSSDAPFQTEAELRDATLAVYTEDYSAYLFERAFSGISDVMNEGTEEEIRQTAAYAMYIEEGGRLTVRLDVSDADPLPVREYDLDRMELLRERENYAVVRIPTTVDGTADCEIELKLVNTAAGWRLDTPTY